MDSELDGCDEFAVDSDEYDPMDVFQGCSSKCTGSCSGDFVTRSLSDPNALTGLCIAFKA